MDFVGKGGLQMAELNDLDLTRAFELMNRYADAPMDLADASLVVMAEKLHTRTIFTVDRTDFSFYRIRSGHRHTDFKILVPS